MAHSVSDKLLGTEGSWVPVHREMARIGRYMCSTAGEMAVWSIVLEMWQEQQGKRKSSDLSALVEVSIRDICREMHAEDGRNRASARRLVLQLIDAGVLGDTGKRTKLGERILSVQPTLDAISASTGLTTRPVSPRDPHVAPTGLTMRPGGVSPRDRGGSHHETGRGLTTRPHSRETSPSYSEGEERSERAAVAGRAGPEAQPTPAIEEGDWLSIERTLRRQRDAALARTTHRHSLTVLLERAQRRDASVLRARPVAMALRDARRQA